MSTRSDAAVRRLRLAFELFRAGADMMRQRLRRQHPDLSTEEIESRLVEWLQKRPGDAPGRSVPWPRRSR